MLVRHCFHVCYLTQYGWYFTVLYFPFSYSSSTCWRSWSDVFLPSCRPTAWRHIRCQWVFQCTTWLLHSSLTQWLSVSDQLQSLASFPSQSRGDRRSVHSITDDFLALRESSILLRHFGLRAPTSKPRPPTQSCSRETVTVHYVLLQSFEVSGSVPIRRRPTLNCTLNQQQIGAANAMSVD